MTGSLVNSLALIKQTYGATASIIANRSPEFVTSTLTARFDFLRSIVSRSNFAVGLVEFCALSP